jgi:hypothetical protein
LLFNSLLVLSMFLLPVTGRAGDILGQILASDNLGQIRAGDNLGHIRAGEDLARIQAGDASGAYILDAAALPVPAVKNPTSLAARLEAHVATLAADSMEGRGLGTDGKVLAKRYIAEQFRLAGIEPLGEDFLHHLDLRVGVARVPATNVVGFLEGSDPALKDEYIVLGAHYDHLGYDYREGELVLFPGADDNASGTAAVIELARHFAQNRDAVGRSIVFVAFDGEESGLLGARKFVEDIKEIGTEQIKLMFSLDMVGMYAANRGVNLLGMGTVDGGSAPGPKAGLGTGCLNQKDDQRPSGADRYGALRGAGNPFGARVYGHQLPVSQTRRHV